jgi:P27 family predicted phage terminase small subunit
MMPRGRKPTPVQLRVLQGNPHRRPIPNTPDPEISADVPEAPDFLYAHARDEWLRIAPELHRMRLLSRVDLKTLEAYCIAYGRWREVEEALAEARTKGEGLLITSNKGRPMEHPLIGTSRRACFEVLRYASEFGLTPAARSRVSQGLSPISLDDKFGDLLEGDDSAS